MNLQTHIHLDRPLKEKKNFVGFFIEKSTNSTPPQFLNLSIIQWFYYCLIGNQIFINVCIIKMSHKIFFLEVEKLTQLSEFADSIQMFKNKQKFLFAPN